MKKYFLLFSLMLLVCKAVSAKTSQCYGTTSQGRIENASQLPNKGRNFIIYHPFASVLARNYVHSKVASVVLNAYKNLQVKFPKYKYMYAETGWKYGGEFKPHKTHQNGLSVDFMVPIIDKNQHPAYLPINFKNKFGYGIEFNNRAVFQSYRIDFEAMAEHLIALYLSAKKEGVKIKRVILAPEFRQLLLNTSQGSYIKKHIYFMKNKAWVRHDEHYHVNFDVDCKKLM